MVTKEQYQAACLQRDKAEQIIHQYGKESIERFEARWKRFIENQEFFTDADLRYSAEACCLKCKAGMAYPKECSPSHQWTCSNVLRGSKTDGGHAVYLFHWYEIKSEGSPFPWLTTRPYSLRIVRSSGHTETNWSIWKEYSYSGLTEVYYELETAGICGSLADLPVVPLEVILNLREKKR